MRQTNKCDGHNTSAFVCSNAYLHALFSDTMNLGRNVMVWILVEVFLKVFMAGSSNIMLIVNGLMG